MTAEKPVSPSESGFQQKLGLFDATMLVTGSMIGSGIFIVSADISRDVGSTGWLMLVWVLTGVMTIMGALSYAELAAMMPHAGGQYVYLREAYSPLWGFLYGWTVFLVIQTGSIAAVAVAFAKYLGVLAPSLGTDNVLWEIKNLDIAICGTLPWMNEPLTFFERKSFTVSAGQLVAVAVTVFLTWLNCRGVDHGRWVQNVFTVAKTIGLVLLIVLGLTIAANADIAAANWSNLWGGMFTTPRFEASQKLAPWGDLVPAMMVVGAAMVGSLFSADAWNNVTFTAGETQNPRRNLPLSLLIGAGLVIGLYLLANVAYLAVLPIQPDKTLVTELEKFDQELQRLEAAGQKDAVEQVRKQWIAFLDQAKPSERGIALAKDDRVATAVLEQVSPKLGVSIMAIAIMISTFGCVNGMILMGARLYYAMARDRLFFKSVGELSHRGVPTAGLFLQGLWSVLLVFSGTYSELLDYVIFAALLFYVLTVVGLFVLRRTQSNAERPYKALGYPWVPALYVLLCAAVMLDLLIVKPVYTWPGLIIVLSGIPVYFVWRRRSTSSTVTYTERGGH